jgi:signal transduction histidine kinase
MSLRLPTRIGLVFASALVTLLLVLATIVSAYRIARADNETISQVQAPSVEASREMRQLVDRIFADQLVFLLDPSSREDMAARVIADWAAFDHWFAISRGHADTPEEQALMASIGQHRDAMRAVDERLRARVRAGEILSARALHRAEAPPHLDAMRRDTEAFNQLNRGQVAQLIAQSFQRFDRARTLSIAITLLGLAVAGLLWWLASRDIVAPLRALKAGADSLAAGRFVVVHHPRAARTFEIAGLERDFNHMSERLQAAAQDLQATNAGLEQTVAARTLELSSANAQLQRLVAELKTLDQLKSNFMAIMSHELLTPINFILGFGSALEDELMGPLNDRQREAIGKMLQGAERLTRMVRNTLEYTQLEAGHLAVVAEPVDYAAVIDDAVRELAPALEAKGQALARAVPDGLPTICVDPDRARQVLRELLDNASKFSPAGSRLHLTVTLEGAFVTTAVSDPGIGIPAEALSKLFTPFYQADFTRTREHGGMGLGLAIAHHLVTKMGGTMHVASATGAGTTVRFTLPREAGCDEAADPGHSGSSRPG